LSHTTDTVIYACYGNGVVVHGNVNGTWDPNYKAVYHMDDAVTMGGQTITDSTSNANRLTTAVSVTSSFAQIAGKINKALHFIPASIFGGASAQSVNNSGTGTSGPWTLEMWVNPVSLSSLDGGSEGQDIGIYNASDTGSPSGAFVSIGATAAGNVNQIEGVVGSNNNAPTNLIAGQPVTGANLWYHVVLSYDGSATTMYVNGTSIGSHAGSWVRNDGLITINGYALSWGFRSVNFALEEFRVSATSRGADWVTASFKNQNSPSTNTFVTVGPELH
jgi:hypothetical protein